MSPARGAAARCAAPRVRVAALALLLVAPGAAPLAAGQPAPWPATLRFEDDHAALGEACRERAFPPCVKRRTVAGGLRVSLGGELALRFEGQRDARFGALFEGADLTTLQRGFVFVDLEAGVHWRAYVQLNGTAAQGRRSGLREVDRTGLEWQNAFVEWRDPAGRAGLRAGAQELRIGGGRLVDTREGLNVRRSFIGARGWAPLGAWRIDAIDLRPKLEEAGDFNDGRDPTQRLRGAFAERAHDGGEWGVALLRREDAAAIGNEGERDERRDTAALQHIGAAAGWEWNVEAMRQWGDAGGLEIDAHALFAEGDYGRSHWPGGLRLGALLGWSSGDARRGDGRLGTFDPLYARGSLIDEDATLFPRNLRSVQATAEFTPFRGWTVQASGGALWRDSLEDGVYRPVGPPLVDAGGSRARRVASTVSGVAERRWPSGWSLLLRGAVLVPGPFLRERRLDDTALWSEAALRYRF